MTAPIFPWRDPIDQSPLSYVIFTGSKRRGRIDLGNRLIDPGAYPTRLLLHIHYNGHLVQQNSSRTHTHEESRRFRTIRFSARSIRVPSYTYTRYPSRYRFTVEPTTRTAGGRYS